MPELESVFRRIPAREQTKLEHAGYLFAYQDATGLEGLVKPQSLRLMPDRLIDLDQQLAR